MTHKNQKIALLAGPTASGKTAFAIHIAATTPTVIINADAMQMVANLSIITARPTREEEAAAEHTLYGTLPATTPTSVALWLSLVKPIIERTWAQNKLPLLVGGTGMYTTALMHGISKIPPIPDEIRQRIRGLVPPPLGGRLGGGRSEALTEQITAPPQPSPYGGGSSLHALLQARDPVMAAKLKPGDTQRLLRALEVIVATGQSLDTWQKLGKEKLFPEAEFKSYYLNPDRKYLYERINHRFDLMMQQGALDEVREFMKLNLHPDTPILRAHGVPELIAYLKNEMSYDDAIAKAKQHTRNYAKRQFTWIRHQIPDAIALEKSDLSKIRF